MPLFLNKKQIMDIQEVYDALLVKVEASSKGISVDRYRAKLALNQAQNTLVSFYLKNKKDDTIRKVQHLLQTKELELGSSTDEYFDFNLPKDLFELSSPNSVAKTIHCDNEIPLSLFEVKEQNLNEILNDEFSKPSILFRESPYNLTNNKLRIYVDNFEISKVNLDYYRYPTQIRLIDEEDFESDFDRNFQLEFDTVTVDRIIDMATSILLLDNKDPSYQPHLIKSTN